MKDQEILRHLAEMKWMFEMELFQPYLEPYFFLKAWEKRTYLRDEMVVISEERARMIMEAQQRQQEEAIAHLAGTKEADRAAAVATADKHLAAAEKFRGEGAAKTAQAQLFAAKSMAEGMPEEAPEAAEGGGVV
jgi:hypothetical protein